MVWLGIMRRWARAIMATGLSLGTVLAAGTVAAAEPETDAAGAHARPPAPPPRRPLPLPRRTAVFGPPLANPDFAADVAGIMRAGKYLIRRVADGYEADGAP